MSSRHLSFAVWKNGTYFFAHIDGLNLNVSPGDSQGLFFISNLSQGDLRRLAAQERTRIADMLYYSSAYSISAVQNLSLKYDLR